MTVPHEFTGNITEVVSCYSLKYSKAHLEGLVHSTITQYVANYFVTWKLLEREKYKCPFSQLQRTGYYSALHLFPGKKSSSSCYNISPNEYLEVISGSLIFFLHICIPIIFFSLSVTCLSFSFRSCFTSHHFSSV